MEDENTGVLFILNIMCAYLELPGGHRRRARHVTVDDGRSNATAPVRLVGEERTRTMDHENITEMMHTGRREGVVGWGCTRGDITIGAYRVQTLLTCRQHASPWRELEFLFSFSLYTRNYEAENGYSSIKTGSMFNNVLHLGRIALFGVWRCIIHTETNNK